MNAFALLFALVQAGNAASSPALVSAPLKTIVNVHASPVCEALTRNVFQAIQGLQANDSLVDQGRILSAKARVDAIADLSGSQSMDATSAVGPASQMDDVRMGQVAHQLALNLARLDALLDDARRFPADPKTDAERNLLVLKARLESVIAKQQVALNLLSGTAESNEANDLLSRTSPVALIRGDNAKKAPIRLAMPEALKLVQQVTRESENDVAPAITPLVAACR